MAYSLSIRLFCEFVSAAVFILMGNGVVACELLASSKGNGMGFGFVSIGFGMAAGFAGMMFGWGSAYFNPAAALAGYIKGDVTGEDLFPIMAVDVAGAFFGQCLVFLTYYSHYQVVPELKSSKAAANVLKEGTEKADSSLKVASHKPSMESIGTTQDQIELEIYKAAVEADQACKLSTCSTRPAIYNPVWNFVCEVINTFILIFGLDMVSLRLKTGGSPSDADFYGHGISGVIAALYVMAMVMNLGGPTGFSANPCRDLGPRLAHFVLPIKGKGSSEFTYSAISISANFVGATLAAYAFMAIRDMPTHML